MSAIGSALRGVIIPVVGLGALSAWADDGRSRQYSLTLPDGFNIEIYARVRFARTITVAAELGTVFVSTLGPDIFAIRDPNLDGHPGPAIKLKDELTAPNGIDWHDGHLYVAERGRVVRIRGPTL